MPTHYEYAPRRVTRPKGSGRFPNMLVREFMDGDPLHTTDVGIVNEVRTYEKLGILPGDVVLDVGACIGSFTQLAWEQGASRIVAVEPWSVNADTWRANAKVLAASDPSCVLDFVQKAALTRSMSTANFTRNDEKVVLRLPVVNTGKKVLNLGHSTVIPYANGDHKYSRVPVPWVEWRELLDVRPNIVKVDIEGGEYELDWSNLPRTIRAMYVEFQGGRKSRDAAMPRIVETLEKQNFIVVKIGSSHFPNYMFRRGQAPRTRRVAKQASNI